MARKIYLNLLALLVSSFVAAANASLVTWTITDASNKATTSADLVSGTFTFGAVNPGDTPLYHEVDLLVRMSDLLGDPLVSNAVAFDETHLTATSSALSLGLSRTSPDFSLGLTFIGTDLLNPSTPPIFTFVTGSGANPNDTSFGTVYISNAPIPTTSTLALLALGIAGLGWSRRRRK